LHHELQTGHCWPFAGSEGKLGVALAFPILVEEVTIDHVAKLIVFDMRSAPREMEVWGLVEGKDNIARVREWKEDLAARKRTSTTYDHNDSGSMGKYIRLANFTYYESEFTRIRSYNHLQS
jgi:SUN domain-containing protein 1/2